MIVPTPDFSEIVSVVRAMIAPMWPLIQVIFAILIGFYLIEWLLYLIPYFIRRRYKVKDEEKEKRIREEIKIYGKELSERERELLWFFRRQKGEI